ncbi:DNA-binding IclR family transcriptional regulator [Rhodoferax ferrireducens]|uniref:DNA-binding IclR family transcriptional regulator n=1 Tax=Rhodoferax ferrireducens TaxID=192843 RepID=A0ABU2C682_9BURK|nr:IclR family transcriptional regulator [Rhodoferax ferrireducens]MDR7376850.1 DNA-binding IclR family transcriptional regulator [Rhodoferax ferrireducens]
MTKPTAPSAPTRAAADAPDDRYRAPALDKGLDILELLASQPQGLTRAEIVKATGRGASEIYRMLERLVVRQYVMRSLSGDRYALSLKLFALAHMHPPLNRLVSQALPVMDVFASRAEQSCHMGVYDRGSVLITAQVNGPSAWGMSTRLGARVGLLDSASGHVLLAFSDAERCQRMLAEHTSLDGEVPMNSADLAAVLHTVRQQGYRQGNSLQSFGVVDISYPILGVDGNALAALTCPYIRRIDLHAGPTEEDARAYLLEAARALSLMQA